MAKAWKQNAVRSIVWTCFLADSQPLRQLLTNAAKIIKSECNANILNTFPPLHAQIYIRKKLELYMTMIYSYHDMTLTAHTTLGRLVKNSLHGIQLGGHENI